MSADEQPIQVAFYSPSRDDRIRIAVEYDGAWRPLFWFKVAKDGSIYAGPRLLDVTDFRKGAKPLQDGALSIKYAEGQTVTDPSLLKAPKVSFHASGVVRAAGDRLLRDSLRTLSKQHELCRVLFQHPLHYRPLDATEVTDRDVCLRYRFDEARPLQGLVFVAPADNARLVQLPSAVNQLTLLFHYKNLVGVPDLLLQFVLGHGPLGPWPPRTYLLFAARAADVETD